MTSPALQADLDREMARQRDVLDEFVRPDLLDRDEVRLGMKLAWLTLGADRIDDLPAWLVLRGEAMLRSLDG